MNSLSDIDLLILLNTAWYVLRLKKFFQLMLTAAWLCRNWEFLQ